MHQSGGTQRRTVDIAPPRRRPVPGALTAASQEKPASRHIKSVPVQAHTEKQPLDHAPQGSPPVDHTPRNSHSPVTPVKGRAQRRKEKHEKRVRSARKLEADYEKIGRMMVTVVDAGYKNRFRLYWISFWKGVWAGLGGVVGATIVVALLLWVAGLFQDAPLFGPLFQFFRSFSGETAASIITRF